MSLSYDFGREGEKIAAEYLQKKGYTIVERNFRFRKAEIDLIAQRGDTLVVVEVKSRTSPYFGTPESFVSSQKIKRLVMAADHYVTIHQLTVTVRFDIISIIGQNQVKEIQHIEDAFYFF